MSRNAVFTLGLEKDSTEDFLNLQKKTQNVSTDKILSFAFCEIISIDIQTMIYCLVPLFIANNINSCSYVGASL